MPVLLETFRQIRRFGEPSVGQTGLPNVCARGHGPRFESSCGVEHRRKRPHATACQAPTQRQCTATACQAPTQRQCPPPTACTPAVERTSPMPSPTVRRAPGRRGAFGRAACVVRASATQEDGEPPSEDLITRTSARGSSNGHCAIRWRWMFADDDVARSSDASFDAERRPDDGNAVFKSSAIDAMRSTDAVWRIARARVVR